MAELQHIITDPNSHVPRPNDFDRPHGRINHWRDELACRVANWSLQHIATDWYCTRVEALVLLGAARIEQHREEKHEL